MTSRPRFLLALVPILVLSAFAAGRADEEQPEPMANESFNGKLHLGWTVLRPDPRRWSLTKNKGKLTITTQKGTIHLSDPNAAKTKNLFLIGNPYGRSADFEVSVCVSDFEPTRAYQQGGLLLYDDDDNYLKFVWESYGDGAHLRLLPETEGKAAYYAADLPQNKGKVWLRLTRNKEKYEYASSGDGKEWTVHGAVAWGEKGPAKLGLIASNAFTDAPEIDTCFTDFRARPLTRVKSD